jgi:hypothetical protein
LKAFMMRSISASYRESVRTCLRPRRQRYLVEFLRFLLQGVERFRVIGHSG